MENVSVKKSKINLKGVFAEKDFKREDFILSIDDSHIVKDISKLTKEEFENHCDYFDDKIVLMQSPEVYINHSCDPNTYVKTEGGVRKVYAMKNISKGEEITYDYSVNGEGDGVFECLCDSSKCRKVFNGNFFKLPKNLQIEYLPYLDTWFLKKYKSRIEKIRNDV